MITDDVPPSEIVSCAIVRIFEVIDKTLCCNSNASRRPLPQAMATQHEAAAMIRLQAVKMTTLPLVRW